jgi:hypothetical protein
MNEIDPASRFSLKAVRAVDSGDPAHQRPAELNDTARTVASQYRRDTMSPVMVAGVLRLVEFAILCLSGLCLYVGYVGVGSDVDWHGAALGAQRPMERRAVIVGGGKTAEALIRSIEQQPYNDIRICGIFDDRDDQRSPPVVAGYPKLGTIAELIEFARIARIDMLIVSLPITAENACFAAQEALGAARRHPPVGAFEPFALPAALLFLHRLGADARHLRQADQRLGFGGQARLRHRLLACFGIVVFSPIMLATAIAIKLDSKGPVIFKQKRHGFNNE